MTSFVLGQATFSFADLSWGADAQSVRSHLEARGYTNARHYAEEDTWVFDGRILGRESWIYAMFTPYDQLVKVFVVLRHNDVSRGRRFAEAESNYRELIRTLEQRYGPARDSIEFFASPYYRGDGYETTAFSAGKATFFTIWNHAADSSLVAVQIDEDVDVLVSYEGPGWGAEVDRRRSAGVSDF